MGNRRTPGRWRYDDPPKNSSEFIDICADGNGAFIVARFHGADRLANAAYVLEMNAHFDEMRAALQAANEIEDMLEAPPGLGHSSTQTCERAIKNFRNKLKAVLSKLSLPQQEGENLVGGVDGPDTHNEGDN